VEVYVTKRKESISAQKEIMARSSSSSDLLCYVTAQALADAGWRGDFDCTDTHMKAQRELFQDAAVDDMAVVEASHHNNRSDSLDTGMDRGIGFNPSVPQQLQDRELIKRDRVRTEQGFVGPSIGEQIDVMGRTSSVASEALYNHETETDESSHGDGGGDDAAVGKKNKEKVSAVEVYVAKRKESISALKEIMARSASASNLLLFSATSGVGGSAGETTEAARTDTHTDLLSPATAVDNIASGNKIG
jgi:hypothetical protein